MPILLLFFLPLLNPYITKIWKTFYSILKMDLANDSKYLHLSKRQALEIIQLLDPFGDANQKMVKFFKHCRKATEQQPFHKRIAIVLEQSRAEFILRANRAPILRHTYSWRPQRFHFLGEIESKEAERQIDALLVQLLALRTLLFLGNQIGMDERFRADTMLIEEFVKKSFMQEENIKNKLTKRFLKRLNLVSKSWSPFCTTIFINFLPTSLGLR